MIQRMKRQDLADELGVSASLVSRYCRRGMPADDVQKAKRWLARNVRARVSDRPAGEESGNAQSAPIGSSAPAEQILITESEGADAADDSDPDAGEKGLQADPTYQSNRALREEASARREWMRMLEDEKVLIRIDQVQATLAARLAPVREAFMQLPSRIAPLIAAETDAAKIQNNLEAEIHEILARLAQ